MQMHDKLKFFYNIIKGRFTVGFVFLVIGLISFAGLVILMEDRRVMRERRESAKR